MDNVSRLSNTDSLRKELPAANSSVTFTEITSQAEVLCGCLSIPMQFLSFHENANDAV